MSLSWCHLPRGITLQNSQIFKWIWGLCTTAFSRLGLFTQALKAGFSFWDASQNLPIPSAPFLPPGSRPSFSGVSLNQRNQDMSEGLNLQSPNFSTCWGCSVSPPIPCPPHLMHCKLLVLLLRACCSLRKLPKMVAQGARAGGRKRRSTGRCRATPQPPPRRLLRLAGTRMTNSSVAATEL